jgi:hypothetical protein
LSKKLLKQWQIKKMAVNNQSQTRSGPAFNLATPEPSTKVAA